jgi:RTC4-like domain
LEICADECWLIVVEAICDWDLSQSVSCSFRPTIGGQSSITLLSSLLLVIIKRLPNPFLLLFRCSSLMDRMPVYSEIGSFPLRLLGSMQLIGNGTASHAGLTCQPDPSHNRPREDLCFMSWCLRIDPTFVARRLRIDSYVRLESVHMLSPVLVPELAVMLIKKDMKVGDETARQILQKRADLGETLHEDV